MHIWYIFGTYIRMKIWWRITQLEDEVDIGCNLVVNNTQKNLEFKYNCKNKSTYLHVVTNHVVVYNIFSYSPFLHSPWLFIYSHAFIYFIFSSSPHINLYSCQCLTQKFKQWWWQLLSSHLGSLFINL